LELAGLGPAARENERRLRRQERFVRGYPNAIVEARIYEAALAEPGATYQSVDRSRYRIATRRGAASVA
jgi:hypothetical protein